MTGTDAEKDTFDLPTDAFYLLDFLLGLFVDPFFDVFRRDAQCGILVALVLLVPGLWRLAASSSSRVPCRFGLGRVR